MNGQDDYKDEFWSRAKTIEANRNKRFYSDRVLGKAFKDFGIKMSKYDIIRKVIKEHQIRIPYDLDMNSTLLISEIEPDFCEEIEERFPEYFV